MIDTTYFKTNVREGQKGEAMASSFLTSIGYQVENVSQDPNFQKVDIDLIAGKEVGERMTIEIKADSMVSRTGNICIETITNVAKGKKGWLYYCKASHIFFVDVVNRIIHCVRFNEFYDMYQQNKDRYRHFIRQQFENGVYYKEAELALIPLEDIKKLPHYNEGRI